MKPGTRFSTREGPDTALRGRGQSGATGTVVPLQALAVGSAVGFQFHVE
ncbi:MAG: hypothetical protein LUQ13_04440 [Methanomicrobiales archaeon]|nr:hypothetical protein [Methanomicrobiales archaeon]